MADKRPAVFIGSSREGVPVAREIDLQLRDDAEPTIWKDNFFKPGMSTLETLTNQLDSFDFAVFVLTPDDKIEARGRNYLSPRDNVLFELGLFMGCLGRGRTFIVHAEGVNLKLPSDFAGITMPPYRSRENLAAALNSACTPILTAIHSLGLRECHKTAYAGSATDNLTSPSRTHLYRCPKSEKAAKQQGMFKECASKSITAKYLVLRGRDILSSEGEIALLSRNAGPHLKIQLLMADFETLSSEKFHEIRESMDLLWDDDLDAEKQVARDRLAFARNLSKRNSGFQYKLLPSNVIPEIKLRLYDHSGFFTFYRRNTGWATPVQNRPIFCVEDQDPSKHDNSPLRITLERWFDELWELSRKPL